VLYRQVHESHAEHWQRFIDSGLYRRLVDRGSLVEHAEADLAFAYDSQAWRVLQPRELSFISYPYEWTFGQLKEAALLTLEVQAEALKVGMTLKDASAYNVAFDAAKPILIDALSFEVRGESEPWVAYRQFCQHFLAPLALMAKVDVRCGLLLRDFIDGIPLSLAGSLLPSRSRIQPGLAMHVHLHSRADQRLVEKGGKASGATASSSGGGSNVTMSRDRLEALVDSLRRTISGLRWDPSTTNWAAYGETTSYTEAGATSKRELVDRFLKATNGDVVWDLGANNGMYTRLAADAGRTVMAVDGDPGAAEQLYRDLRKASDTRITPLLIDLSNPSPALGWAGTERRSLSDRANADVLIALALVHHLAIGNNVPFDRISSYLAQLGRQLIIEFVPKEDPRVVNMLKDRRDVFNDYTLKGLTAAFAKDWTLVEEVQIDDSLRTLLRFERRQQL
jgi:hypothetical protein